MTVTLALTVLGTLVAGSVGAVVRATLVARAPRAGTTAVNLAGTLLLAGVLAAVDRELLDGLAALVLGVGLSGSLTTFSGWVALLDEGLHERPGRTVLVDLLLPLSAAIGLVVLVFATWGGGPGA